MDHITQLKKIRAEALARLRDSEDFKLAGKLGQLIVELGDTVDDVPVFDDLGNAPLVAQAPPIAKPQSKPLPTFESAFLPAEKVAAAADDDSEESIDVSDEAADETIDELVAEIEGGKAELDALMSESSDSSDSEEEADVAEEDETVEAPVAAKSEGLKSLSSFRDYFDTEKSESRLANGAAH